MSEDDSAQLLDDLRGERLEIPTLLGAACGLRRGEILALPWTEVHLDTSPATLSVAWTLEQVGNDVKVVEPKTKRSRRRITLPECVVVALRRHRTEQAKQRLLLGSAWTDHNLVCPEVDGSYWKPDLLSAAFRYRIRQLKVPTVRFHDLRHSHATHLFHAGVHPKIVSERLGHSSVTITLDTYSHVLPDMQETAALAVDSGLGAAISRVVRKNR